MSSCTFVPSLTRVSRDNGGCERTKPRRRSEREIARSRSSCSAGVSPRQSWYSTRVVGPTMDDLVGPIGIEPVNCRPKCGMAGDQAIPRLLECGQVELASKTADELLDVVSCFGISERMEEHPFLHRREGIQILDASVVRERELYRLEVDALGSQLKRCDSQVSNFRSSPGDPSSTRSPRPALRCSGAGTGAWGSTDSPACRARDTIWMPRIESTPISKKLSWTPTRLRPSKSAAIPAKDLLRGRARRDVFGLQAVP